jgi:predicted transcriptional regulator
VCVCLYAFALSGLCVCERSNVFETDVRAKNTKDFKHGFSSIFGAAQLRIVGVF